MIKTSNTTPVISPCSHLVWHAYRNQDVQATINRLALIDDAVKNTVLAEAPPLKHKNMAIRSGYIDGVINANGAKLLYVAVSFDSEPLDSHLLHAHRQLADLRQKGMALDACFMLVINKTTGGTREVPIVFDERFVFDYQAMADASTPGACTANDMCRLCPLRFDCEEAAKHGV